MVDEMTKALQPDNDTAATFGSAGPPGTARCHNDQRGKIWLHPGNRHPHVARVRLFQCHMSNEHGFGSVATRCFQSRTIGSGHLQHRRAIGLRIRVGIEQSQTRPHGVTGGNGDHRWMITVTT